MKYWIIYSLKRRTYSSIEIEAVTRSLELDPNIDMYFIQTMVYFQCNILTFNCFITKAIQIFCTYSMSLSLNQLGYDTLSHRSFRPSTITLSDSCVAFFRRNAWWRRQKRFQRIHNFQNPEFLRSFFFQLINNSNDNI